MRRGRGPAAGLAALCATGLAAASAGAAGPGIQAHRGGSVLAGKPRFPENTMPAFRNAILREHVTIELDASFARRHRARVSPEIKNVPTDGDWDPTAAFAERVMDAVIASRFPKRRLIVQSFVPANLDVARRRLPGVATSFLKLSGFNDGGLEQATTRHDRWISPQWPVTAAYVRRAHRAKLKVVPYTLDTARDVRRAARVGVDALITDDPVMARRALAPRRR